MEYSPSISEQATALLQSERGTPLIPPDRGYKKYKHSSKNSRVKGMGLMFAAVLLSHVNRFCMKEAFLLGGISSFEGIFFRCFFILVFNLVYAGIFKVNMVGIPKTQWKWIATRAFAGFLGGNLSYLALKSLDYSMAVVLEFTNPIFVGIFAAILLKEKITKFDYLALVMAFVGVLFYANPQWVGGQADEQSVPEGSTLHSVLAGIIVAVGASITVAVGSVSLRQLGQNIHYAIPTFYWSLVVCTITPWIIILGDYPNGSHYSGVLFLLLVGSGASTFFSDMLITLASKYEKAGRLAAISYFEIIFGFILDATVFGGMIQYADIVAAFLIISCNLILALLKCTNRIE